MVVILGSLVLCLPPPPRGWACVSSKEEERRGNSEKALSRESKMNYNYFGKENGLRSGATIKGQKYIFPFFFFLLLVATHARTRAKRNVFYISEPRDFHFISLFPPS